MKRFLAGVLCSAMLCTEILSASTFATTNAEPINPDEVVSIEETADSIYDEGLEAADLEDDSDDILVEADNDAALEADVDESVDVVVGAPEDNGDALDDDINEVALAEIDGKPTTVGEEWNGKRIPATDGTDCFTVSANTLYFKAGVTKVPQQNIVIPSYVDANGNNKIEAGEIVYKISSDIFKNDRDQTNITVTFAGNSEVQEIAEEAFYNSNVTEITLPEPGYKTRISDDGSRFEVVKNAQGQSERNYITEIKKDTFKKSALVKINAEQATKLEVIREGAFEESHILEFTAPEGLKTIEQNAFSNSYLKLLSLVNVEKIEASAFQGCADLGKTADTVSFTNSIKEIGDNAFENCGFSVLNMKNATNLEKLGKGVFKNCKTMTKITLPCAMQLMTGVSEEMFMNCEKLATVTFAEHPNFIYTAFGSTIGVSAFQNCTSLKSVVFPDSIVKIDSKAFAGCSKLEEIEIAGDFIDSEDISDDAFPVNKTLITVKGTSSAVEKYCQEHSDRVKFKNIAQENKITYEISNASYEASTTKAKAGEEVTLKITPKTGYALIPGKTEKKLLSAKNKKGVEKELTLVLVSCDNKSQTFSFKMPRLADSTDVLTVKASVLPVDTYKDAEKTLKPEVVNKMEDGFTTLTEDRITTGRWDGTSIKFKTRGEQVPLLIRDGDGTKIGPWRFKFESTDETVATVTADGTVTAGSNKNNKNAQIIATLLSNNKSVTIPVQVEESITIDDMLFQFNRINPRTGKTMYSLPSRVSQTWVNKYEEVTKTNPATGEKYTEKVLIPYQMIVIPKTKIKKGDITFTSEALPRSKEALDPTKSYVVKSSWSSRDSSIATVEKKEVTDNLNKITVKKNASGETEIRVKVTNDHLDKSDPLYQYEFGYIIRIDNDIPRLTEKNFTINTYKEKGYELQIVEGYKSGVLEKTKYKIASNKLTITDAKGNDMTSDFIVTYYEDEGKYYIKETEKVRKSIKEGKKKSFTKLYLSGQIEDNLDVPNEGTFDISLGTITVEKKALAADIKVEGTINKFYDARYDDDDHSYSGAVKLTQTNLDEKVEGYYLVTAEHHEEIQKKERDVFSYVTDNPDSPLFDALRANFTFGYIQENTGTTNIYRTRTEKLAQIDGVDVVSGYLYIKYAGYSDYLYKEITIPVKKTKPKYIFDVASGTAGALQHNQEYNVLLVDKKTKKLPVRDQINPDGTVVKNAKGEVQREYIDLLSEVYKDDNGNVISQAKYWFDVDTDGNVFDKTRTDFIEKAPKYVDLNNSKKKEEKSYRSIPISVINPYKDTAIVWVQLYNWAEPIKYTFSLKTTSKIAKASLTKKKVTLYTEVKNTPAEFNVKLNQKFAKLELKDINEDGIKVTFTQDEDKPYICLAKVEFAGSSASAGTYKLQTEGTVVYSDESDGSVELAKPIKFKVVVKEKEPTIKLKKTTFTLNSNKFVTGVELVGSKYSFKNVPVGDNGYAFISENSVSANTVWINGVSYNGISENKLIKGADVTCLTKNPKTKEPYEGIAENVVLKIGKSKKDGDYDLLMVGLEEGKYKKGTYKLKVSGVKITDKYNNEIKLKDFTFKVKIKESKISVTQKVKGTINPIDPKSTTVFIPKFKNFGNIHIISANFVATDKYGKRIGEQNFRLTAVSQNSVDVDKMSNISVDNNGIILANQYMLTSISGNNLTKGKAYYGLIKYDYIAADGTVQSIQSKKFKVKLKQVVPSVSLKYALPKNADNINLSTVMYSGSDSDQVCTIRVNPKSQKSAQLDSIEVYLPTNATKLQKNIKRAFEPRVLKAEAPSGYTAKETRSLRMDSRCYKVYALVDGEMVLITKPASYSISVNDVDPTSTKRYDYVPEVFDEAAVELLIDSGKLNTDDVAYYSDAVTEIQTEECKYYRSLASNKSYEKKEGHYYVKVELLNASAITKNKETDVVFEVKYKNQIKKTDGTLYGVKITVKK